MLAQYWPEFIMLFTFNLINLISPGAGCAITMRNSSIYSRKTGLLTGFGIVTSSLIHKTYSLLGFGLVISQTPWLFNFIKYIGAAYLFYLAFQCFRGLLKPAGALKKFSPKEEDIPMTQAFKIGFFTDMLNPAASLGFITILSATVSPSTPTSVLAIYGAVMICCSLIWYSTLAMFFSSSLVKMWVNKASFVMEGVTGGFLLFLGFKLFTAAI